MTRLLFWLLLPFGAAGQPGIPSLGMWREHLPYQVATDLTASAQTVYAATPLSLFSVSLHNHQTERFSKVSGLSETGISTIQYDNSTNKLYVAYTNSNLDVLTAGNLRNIPGIKRSSISGDKNIYQIFPDGARCYLSTGLGVVVVDAERYEVKETWLIGNNGDYVKTTGFARAAGYFYAATVQGLKRTPVTNASPADFRTWQSVAVSGSSPAPAKSVVSFNNKAVVLQNDSAWIENGNSWALLFANGWPVVSIHASGNQLLLSQQKNTGGAQVVVLNEAGVVQSVLQHPAFVLSPQKALFAGGSWWIADLAAGLVRLDGNTAENFKLNSPQNVVLGEMTVSQGTLWATAGAVNSSWNYQYNPSGLFRLQNDEWLAYSRYQYPQLDTVLDWLTIAADPRDGSAWAGSFGGGLVHLQGNGPQIFKQNSPLSAPPGDPSSYRVSGLAFDAGNNLWVANFGSTQPLRVLKADNTWQSFTLPFFLNQNAVAQIVIDDAGQKWVQAPLGNGVLVFDQGKFETPADDRWRLYRSGIGMGNLPSNEVLCLAKDKYGFIWVGSTTGLAVFQCPQEALATGCEAALPVIREGGFAAYLFNGQEVRSIAVDGANRKWIATASGAWLVSPDGDQVLANYTETNSPLFSNDVKKITIDGSTGEVFFATAKGLISLRGTATEASETKGSVLVYPNPVPPGFNGTIGIRGLPENSLVKITEAAGRLVYQTRSLGGQAVWDGRDYRGNKVATGVYLVLAVDSINGETVVAKIVLVR